MKKILCLFLLVAFGMAAKAQTSAGSILLGGGFRLSSTTYETAADDLKASSFSITPSAGYFLSDNFALGVDIEFSSNKYTNDDKENDISVSPFVRFYKFLAEDKFAFYGQGNVSIASGKYDPDTGNETKTSSFGISASPGFAYFFNEKWSLDLQLAGISFRSYDPDKDGDNDKRKDFVFGASSFSPSLGFRYFIGK